METKLNIDALNQLVSILQKAFDTAGTTSNATIGEIIGGPSLEIAKSLNNISTSLDYVASAINNLKD